LEPRAQRDEAERVAALDALVLLGSPAEPRFDRLTRVTQRHFRVSIALVGLVGADRVWFKSKQGTGVCHIPRDTSFCERVIQSEGVFCVQNALEDPEFSGHPFVSGPSNIRFYAGVPLHAPGGQRIGTLGILDREPRTMAQADSEALLDFGALVDEEIGKGLLNLQDRRLRSIIDGTRIGTWEWNVQTGECEFNERWAGIAGYTLAELAPVSIQTWFGLAHPTICWSPTHNWRDISGARPSTTTAIAECVTRTGAGSGSMTAGGW
jgi:PAS domain-containing protein